MKVFTVREAAEAARISHSTLYKRARDGNGPNITKIGARSVITSDDLEFWLKNLPVLHSRSKSAY